MATMRVYEMVCSASKALLTRDSILQILYHVIIYMKYTFGYYQKLYNKI